MADKPLRRAVPAKLVVAQPIRPTEPKRVAESKRPPVNNPPPAAPAPVPADAAEPSAGGMDWDSLIGDSPALPSHKATLSAKGRAHPKARRGSRWVLPITLLCIVGAAGFVGYAIYTFNNSQQPPPENVAFAPAAPKVHAAEPLSKIKAKPSTTSAAGIIGKAASTPAGAAAAVGSHPPVALDASAGAPNPAANESDAGSLAGLLGSDSSKVGQPVEANSPAPAAQESSKESSKTDESATAGEMPKKPAVRPNAVAVGSFPRGAGLSQSASTAGGGSEKTAIAADVGPAFGDDQLLDLFARKKLFLKTSYPAIRHIFARRFEDRHKQEIQRAFGADFDKMNHWLDDNLDIKEELYLAIDEKYNNIVAALSLFKRLKDQFPEKIVPYANLAIATAVSWDKADRAIYDYLGNIHWTKSKIDADRLDAAGNFAYFMEEERVLGDRLRMLPWEFLVHVVNHRTPVAERKWAGENYFLSRSMYGVCYKDVPYDHDMLNSNFAKAKLNGQDYTLENIRKFGGVCAEQADFAARVGKSIGVPAEFVHGESTFGESHAWVMWVELLNVTKTSIVFRLESYGRYSYDKYYVGGLTDPRTGQEITDRDLELRLQAVGADPIAHRQAALAMRAYPMLREKNQMTVLDQLKFLDSAMNLSPWLEAPWLEVARMSRDGLLGKEHGKQMLGILNRLFITFADVPDFTWKVFDDLITFQTVPKQRAKLYERLVSLYELAGRPDLSCEARLKYVDYLVKQNRYQDAMDGLAITVKKFPDEGRYVPRLLDRLQEVCKESNLPRTDENMVLFYKDYLPMIPPKRGDRASPFCMKMYERAINLFKANGNKDLADSYAAQLAKLKSG